MPKFYQCVFEMKVMLTWRSLTGLNLLYSGAKKVTSSFMNAVTLFHLTKVVDELYQTAVQLLWYLNKSKTMKCSIGVNINLTNTPSHFTNDSNRSAKNRHEEKTFKSGTSKHTTFSFPFFFSWNTCNPEWNRATKFWFWKKPMFHKKTNNDYFLSNSALL